MVQRLLDFKALADLVVTSAFVDGVFETEAKPVGKGKASVFKSESPSTSAAVRETEPNKEFTYALGDAFALGFKARRNKPAEMIAKYLDKAMRKGQQSASTAEFDALLNSALELYRFTEDKDVFRTFYHRALAKRLLLQKSASDGFEKSILNRLKERKRRFLRFFSETTLILSRIRSRVWDGGRHVQRSRALAGYHERVPEKITRRQPCPQSDRLRSAAGCMAVCWAQRYRRLASLGTSSSFANDFHSHSDLRHRCRTN